jgi:uncharacterized surface protein with fasciclin (FAS1) repeats/nucleoid-associated protein YgaU
MYKTNWQRLLGAALVAALLVTGFAPAAMAATTQTAPSAVPQQVSGAKEVSGTLTGGQFAKIWLALTPDSNPGTVTLTADWDRPNADSSNVGFYVLNESNLQRVLGGDSLIDNNVAQGQSSFFLNGADNVQGARFNATGPAYTVVVFNDSATDASFTLRAEGGTLADDSGQVRVPGAATPEATGEAAATGTVTETVAAPAAAATEEVTATAATTETAPAATPAPAATVTTTTTAAAVPAGPVRAEKMQGSLPEQFSQHFLGLEPTVRDGEVTLVMTYDPQDNTELARRINFWVLDDAGFKRFQAGDSASTVALAAGSKFFLDPDTSNKRSATFKSTGFGPYTVIVQNNSRVPATYDLTATGGILLDDSGQTITAQQAGGVAPAATGATTETATAGAATATTATTATTTTAGSGVAGEPGGTYTVKSGDTLAIIARDLYGDYRLYEQLCAFNKIADCNVIEVGQVINLPTKAEIGAVESAPAAAATPAAAAAAATPEATVAAAPATTTTVTSTAAVTSTAPVTTTAATTATTATTGTASVAATTATTRTATTGATTAAASGTLLDALQKAGNYSILLAAIKQAGLESSLNGAGPLTVFAPTDDAFNNLFSENNITEARFLQIPELDQLLKLHVIPGRLLEADLTNGQQETTLEGSNVTFTVTADGVKVNDSFITQPDVTASNGVIQAINAVMLPAR